MNPPQINPSQPRTIQLRPDSPVADQPAPVPPRRHEPHPLGPALEMAERFYRALFAFVVVALLLVLFRGGAL